MADAIGPSTPTNSSSGSSSPSATSSAPDAAPASPVADPAPAAAPAPADSVSRQGAAVSSSSAAQDSRTNNLIGSLNSAAPTGSGRSASSGLAPGKDPSHVTIGGKSNNLWNALKQAGWSDKQIANQGLVKQVAKANNLKNPNLVHNGQHLTIPVNGGGGRGTPNGSPTKPAPASPAPASPAPASPAPASPAPASPAPASTAPASPAPASPAPASPAPASLNPAQTPPVSPSGTQPPPNPSAPAAQKPQPPSTAPPQAPKPSNQNQPIGPKPPDARALHTNIHKDSVQEPTPQQLQDNVRTVAAVARKLGVDPATAVAAMLQESKGNQYAVGDHGSSYGLFQLHRGGELGRMDPHQAMDPYTNAQTALSEFARKQRSGLTGGALAAAAQNPRNHAAYAAAVNRNMARARQLLQGM